MVIIKSWNYLRVINRPDGHSILIYNLNLINAYTSTHMGVEKVYSTFVQTRQSKQTGSDEMSGAPVEQNKTSIKHDSNRQCCI